MPDKKLHDRDLTEEPYSPNPNTTNLTTEIAYGRFSNCPEEGDHILEIDREGRSRCKKCRRLIGL